MSTKYKIEEQDELRYVTLHKHRTRHKVTNRDMGYGAWSQSEPAESDFIAAQTVTTDYVSNKVYKNGQLSMLLTEEGYIEKSGSTYTHHYYLKDHIGNHRIVINSAGTVVQATNCYPSGTTMADYPRATTQGVQPYKFGGKELDRKDNLNFYDYEARAYDPALMRFTSTDPMMEKYYAWSPYAYCLNNPINFIDPDGNDPVPAASRNVIGSPAYYQWRYNNFVARNPNATAPSYYLNYGLKYAQRFQNQTNAQLSQKGQKWLGETMVNLQTSMESRLSQQDGTELELIPQAFKKFAFDSHVDAYWNKDGTTPLYTLNTVDLFSIVLTPDLNDLTSQEGMTQAGAIMGKLGDYWLQNPKVGAQRAGELMIYQDKIKKMIAEKAGTEIGDRAKVLFEQLKSILIKSNE